MSDDRLLSYGVPAEWLGDVRNATEDTLLTLADHLPAEAAEALLELATGGKPRVQEPVVATEDPFDHPDARRRFRVMTNVEELERALDFPWEKWMIFLHPEQRQWVEREYNGPARVSGSVGTGKTIVALHRAAYLARTNPDARVLLTTFTDTLANALQAKLRRLLGSEPRLAERIDVFSLDAVEGHGFGSHFLFTEWDQVVDAWQLGTWEAYRDVARLGRKTRLPEAQREVLWAIFERVRSGLQAQGLITRAQMFTTLAAMLSANKNVIYDFSVIDEAQDLSVAHLRFLAALGGGPGQ
jgi:superfamily I DNA/RNA helicase